MEIIKMGRNMQDRKNGLVGIAAGGLAIYSLNEVARADNGGHYTDEMPVAGVGESVVSVTNSVMFTNSHNGACSAIGPGSEIAAVSKWRPTDSQVRTNSHIHMNYNPSEGDVTNLVWRYIQPNPLPNGQSTPQNVFGVSCSLYSDSLKTNVPLEMFTQGDGNTYGGNTNVLSADGKNNRTTAVNVPIYDSWRDFVQMASPNSTNFIMPIVPEPSLTGFAMFGVMVYSFIRGRMNSRKSK